MSSPRPNRRSSERDAGLRLSERREQTRLRVVRAAASVFAAKAFSETTVEDILRAAGVSRRTFYQFFADKLDVLATVYGRSVNHLHALRVEAASRGASGIECILNGVDVYLSFQASAGPLVRVLASEALRPGSPLVPMRQELIDRTVDLYCKRFEEIEGRAVDPLVVRALVLMSDALVFHMLSTTRATKVEIERVRRVIHHTVRRALASET